MCHSPNTTFIFRPMEYTLQLKIHVRQCVLIAFWNLYKVEAQVAVKPILVKDLNMNLVSLIIDLFSIIVYCLNLPTKITAGGSFASCHSCQTYQNKAIDHPTSDIQLICKCRTTKPQVKKTLSDENKMKKYTQLLQQIIKTVQLNFTLHHLTKHFYSHEAIKLSIPRYL